MNILKHLKTFVVVAVAAMAFASCSKEQTSLSIYDFQGRAKIMGHVSYCVKEGLIYDPDYSSYNPIEKIDSAANKQIFIKISNAEFDDEQEGFTVIQTKTDKNGDYEIEIPVPDEGVNVRIQAESFVDFYKYVRLNNNGEEESCETKEGVYSMAEETIKLFPNEIKFHDLEYEFNRGEDDEHEGVKTVTVKVGLGFCSTYDGSILFKPTRGIIVTLTDKWGEGSWSNKTNVNGIAEISVPKSIGDVLVAVNDVDSHSFPYYYNIPEGIWLQYSDDQRGIVNSQLENLYSSRKEIKVKMVYVTSEKISEEYGYDWQSFNWYNADFE